MLHWALVSTLVDVGSRGLFVTVGFVRAQKLWHEICGNLASVRTANRTPKFDYAQYGEVGVAYNHNAVDARYCRFCCCWTFLPMSSTTPGN